MPNRTEFIHANLDWMCQLMKGGMIPVDAKGVHFAFVHRYRKPNTALDGQLCVVLGRESAGRYQNQFNFFGGQIDHGDGPNPPARILGAAFRELWEEMGVQFKTPLVSAVIDIIVVGKSVLFVCAVAGISCTKLNAAIKSKRGLPGQYNEMTETRHITERDLGMCSEYVRKQFGRVVGAYGSKCTKSVHFDKAMRAVRGKCS
jgi:hypothetical protein